MSARWLAIAVWLIAAHAHAQSWSAEAPPPPPERLPHGGLHAGIQIDGGLGLGFIVATVYPSGHVAAAVVIDFVLGLHGTFRLALFGESITEARAQTDTTGARILFGFDEGQVTVRLGLELGAGLRMERSAPDTTSVGFALNGQARVELCGRVLDAQNLEIGIALHGGIDGLPAAFADAFVTYVFE